MPPVAPAVPISTAKVAPHILLDSRRAFMHETEGWMAVADLHYGYEMHRRRHGALLPQWGMEQCEQTLLGLLADHCPQRLILVGDIMDGSGSAKETAGLLDRLRNHVGNVICILGNHDRPALRRSCEFVEVHWENGFLFHHGHRWDEMAQSAVRPSNFKDGQEVVIHITGHEHPAVHFCDGAGLSLRLPASVQEQVDEQTQRWILPAFSPWAAGGEYRSEHFRLATWVCGRGRVWRT